MLKWDKLQAFEFGLRPKDQFKVMQHFDLNTNHLEVLNRLYTPLIGTQAVGLYHFMTQFVKESHNETLILSHYIFMNELKINLLKLDNKWIYLKRLDC